MTRLPVPMTAPRGSGERLLWAIAEWGGGRVPILLYLVRKGGSAASTDLVREFVGVSQSTVVQQVEQMGREQFLLFEPATLAPATLVGVNLQAIRQLVEFVESRATEGGRVWAVHSVEVELEARRWWRRPRGSAWVAPHCLAFARELRRLL